MKPLILSQEKTVSEEWSETQYKGEVKEKDAISTMSWSSKMKSQERTRPKRYPTVI